MPSPCSGVGVVHRLELYSAAFPGHQQGAGWEMEKPGMPKALGFLPTTRGNLEFQAAIHMGELDEALGAKLYCGPALGLWPSGECGSGWKISLSLVCI